MRNKISLIDSLCKDVVSCARAYGVAEGKEQWGELIGNRNFGKTALKRKIILLRQELLSLSQMIDNEWGEVIGGKE